MQGSESIDQSVRNLGQIPSKIFQRERYLMMKYLAQQTWVEFTEIRDKLGMSDGNLASHLRALEGLNFVEYRKEFSGRRSKTLYKLTPAGFTNFQTLVYYLKESLGTVQYPTNALPS